MMNDGPMNGPKTQAVPATTRRRWPEPTKNAPNMTTLMRWDEQGFSKATDGCKVESDGVCPHGHPSWLLVAGLI